MAMCMFIWLSGCVRASGCMDRVVAVVVVTELAAIASSLRAQYCLPTAPSYTYMSLVRSPFAHTVIPQIISMATSLLILVKKETKDQYV